MIVFLYGSDGYRLKENVDTIVDAYNKKHKSGMSHYRFDLESGSDLDRLENAVKSISFFDEAKLIIVKNPFSAGNDFLNKLASLTGDLKVTADKTTVLVFVENRREKELQKTDKDLFAFLTAKPNLVRAINYLEGTKLSNWVRGKFKEEGHDVSPAVVRLLINVVGNPALADKGGAGDSWALANEISKLSNYKKRGTVTEKDVNLLVSRKEDDSIFDLVDAVGSQNKAKAFEMLYRLTNSGHDPHYLLVMLVYHFENLLSVSDGSTPKHLHPFVARKAAVQARKFSKEGLLSKFNHLAGLDISSKNGLTNLEDSLYNFVIS
ncbi:MAG TPA: DNA polymerase III subunit delta [Candidatus Paceibacterota bacterium]|nr:DNA polymerase III subunit delta [Candidatus Paceibacterota bacterium]